MILIIIIIINAFAYVCLQYAYSKQNLLKSNVFTYHFGDQHIDVQTLMSTHCQVSQATI